MQIKVRTSWVFAFVAAGFYLLPMAEERIAFARTRPSPQEPAPNFSLNALTGVMLFTGKLDLLARYFLAS